MTFSPALVNAANKKAPRFPVVSSRCWRSAVPLARDLKILLLDEPYEGLAPVIVQEIEKTLHLIRKQGITTVIVEQNAIAALNLADRALILDTG